MYYFLFNSAYFAKINFIFLEVRDKCDKCDKTKKNHANTSFFIFVKKRDRT